MWFEDLTPYELRRDDHRASSVATLNVGWLENGRQFTEGSLPSAAFERLGQLVRLAPTNSTRGMHFCDLCPPSGEVDWSILVEAHAWGKAEVRAVGSDGRRYAAPTLVHHYVTEHGYLPPQPFVAAMLRMAHLQLDAVKDTDQCFACGSPMARLRTDKLVRVVDGRREPVTVVWLDCEGCGTQYARHWADSP